MEKELIITPARREIRLEARWPAAPALGFGESNLEGT